MGRLGTGRESHTTAGVPRRPGPALNDMSSRFCECIADWFRGTRSTACLSGPSGDLGENRTRTAGVPKRPTSASPLNGRRGLRSTVFGRGCQGPSWGSTVERSGFASVYQFCHRARLTLFPWGRPEAVLAAIDSSTFVVAISPIWIRPRPVTLCPVAV